MTALHAHFNLRNQQAFQRLLDASRHNGGGGNSHGHGQTTLSSSGGRSWNKPSSILLSTALADTVDVNARDWLGRTVLHLAVTSLEPAALEYVRLLLNHPKVDVNLADTESQWTALHRALYAGNLGASLLLLRHTDIDTSLKDMEGYTAFELYNSTVEGTKPPDFDPLKQEAILYTWGANRNAALGLGDGDDRAYPEQVVLKKSQQDERERSTGNISGNVVVEEKKPLKERFSNIGVKGIVLSKVHTTVVTSENTGNIRQCGLGGSGRLGPNNHTQYSFVQLPLLNQAGYTITSVAVGQDHTLALTSEGEILSWGFNRFSQLGYVVEAGLSGVSAGGFGSREEREQIQVLPRKITVGVRGKIVKGVAACKTASACWTREEVFTWGTNAGQLGYDRSAHPVQVTPRKVPQLDVPVVGIAITENAMACLLQTKDVICFWNDRHFKINFSSQSFPSEIIQTYRPPMATNSAHICKITSCDGLFAALTVNGEVFTFNFDAPTAGSESGGGKGNKTLVTPHRVWALRKQYNAVKDVALGSDGTLILCTESGHVYVRSRGYKGGSAGAQGQMKPFKFQRMPYIQRVVRVAANETGALTALRIDAKKEDIMINGKCFAGELWSVMPALCYMSKKDGSGLDAEGVDDEMFGVSSLILDADVEEDEMVDLGVQNDIRTAKRFCDLLKKDKESRAQHGHGLFDPSGYKNLPHGADLMIQVSGNVELPAHRIILASRCAVLSQIIFERKTVKDGTLTITGQKKLAAKSPFRLTFSSCHPLSVLILLGYIYSDELVALWDRRIGMVLESDLAPLKVNVSQIKAELQTFARMLSLPRLLQALDYPSKRAPTPSLSIDMRTLFLNSQLGDPVSYSHPLFADTILELQDKTVYCHSTILRARSPFFSSFFDDEEWTDRRWSSDKTVIVALKHLTWRVMEFVLRYIYCDEREEMFEVLEFVSTVDNVLDFMFEVMAAASELLLDRLSLVCSTIILQYTNLSNVCSILTDATFYHAPQLIVSLQGYIACNLETLLESRMLDDLTPDLIKNLSVFITSRQAEKLSVSRSNKLVELALRNHKDWLMEQDMPQIIVPSAVGRLQLRSPKTSPSLPARMRRQSSGLPSPSQIMSPVVLPQPVLNPRAIASGDEVFSMDESDLIPPLTLEQSQPSTPTSSAPRPWKAPSTQNLRRVDLKKIMNEAESARSHAQTSKTSVGSGSKRVVGFDIAEDDPSGNRVVTTLKPVAIRMTPSSSLSSSSTESSRIAPPSGLSQTRRDVSNLSQSPGRLMLQPAVTSPRSGPATPTKPGMGPTFTPIRTATASSSRVPLSSRKSSETSGSAWTVPAVQPIPPPVPSASPPSFAAIQQQQRDQGLGTKKPKQSLLQIQEEEQARQAEEDFLKWWTAEEERMKLENGSSSSTPSPKPNKKPRPKRNSSSKGKSLPSTQSRTHQDPRHV